MAHFAEFDSNHVVLRVIVVDDSFAETEEQGIAFCKTLFGENTTWLQTSYNTYANTHRENKTPLRKNYAGVGYTYDPQRDAFIPPKPVALEGEEKYLAFDEDKCIWYDVRPQPKIGVTRL